MTPRLQLTALRKTYGSFTAVEGTDLTLGEGEFLTLLGPSGCGKTTTLRLIGGMEKPSSGRIEINGKRVDHLPSYKRDTATVFQSGALFPHLTVTENMAYGLKMRGVPSSEIPGRIARMLDVVQMGRFAARYPSGMSGGQRQRVALARAMVVEPSILLFDEPMSALDLKLKLELRSEIRRLHRELGFTAVFVTHDQSEAMTLSDRVVIMNQGRIEQSGAPVETFERPASAFVYSFLGESCQLAIDADAGRDGSLRLANAPGAGRHLLFLRPASLRRVSPGEAPNEADARVAEVEYLGGSYRLHADAPSGRLSLDLSEAPALAPGDGVTIGWDSADATWFPAP
ncbi:ABC transporter ATP-binding protein [Pseudogemmobacter humi]|uniref:Spermidine/putrescine import ATP-binding protein PotA n=1 Tax=Pseudogemmobacter humi TaxID=2483812 RepID=A0A3P5XGJ7_9RHOB|nr:ABC transporter ATP-binding protein [Pseudogemmobacter humi]VDC33923.1 Spermidine/putrescine import ATP-binding protein PotA [Pseudogemmobacter humi]